jgi:hypothetical protein
MTVTPAGQSISQNADAVVANTQTEDAIAKCNLSLCLLSLGVTEGIAQTLLSNATD